MNEDREPGVPPPWMTTVLVGHAEAEHRLLEAYRSGRLHHAWLIGGPAGIGKATLAWRLARFILAHPDPASAAVREAATLDVAVDAPSAQRIAAGSHGDVVALSRAWNDKAKKLYSEIRVDDVRRALGLFQTAAGAGGYRICILDSADDLNRSSANALLKLIEEPPPRSLFLILAHRPGQVMPTLVSRCRRLTLAPLGADEVAAGLRHLGLGRDLPPGTGLDDIARRARGSIAEALRLLDRDALMLDDAIRRVLEGLPQVHWPAVHGLADAVGTADERFDLAIEAIFTDLARRVEAGAARNGATATLARLAAAWDRVRTQAREASALNLDKRPVLLAIVADLAEATASS